MDSWLESKRHDLAVCGCCIAVVVSHHNRWELAGADLIEYQLLRVGSELSIELAKRLIEQYRFGFTE